MVMKTICIYHKNCFDGICAAWVVSKVYPDTEFIPMNYGDDFPEKIYYDRDLHDYELIFVDFSLPRAELIQLERIFDKLLVLDHHKTAQKELEGLSFAIFDMNESGASLAWKHFFPNESLPLLVKYIKDRDLWLFKEEYSHEVNAWIQSFPMMIEVCEELFQRTGFDVLSGNLAKPIEGGASILRYKETMTQTMCKQARIQVVGNYAVPVVNATTLFSEVGHELCKKYPTAPFAACYFDRILDGMRQWELRSIGDFDVSEVAKKLGGGGHKNAAGFVENLK